MSGLGAWFKKQGVQPGEWYGEAKAFTKAAVRAGLSCDAAIVLFALRPYTVGYRSEKAIKQVWKDGKKMLVPVPPADLSKDTGFSRQKVRDALEEIEAKGFGARKASDGGTLRKGNVEIYCWTVPRRPPTSARDTFVPRMGYKVSNKITHIARISDLRLPKGFVPSREYKEYVEKAFLEYKEATKVPQERLKQALFVAPDAPAYKEERKPFKEGKFSSSPDLYKDDPHPPPPLISSERTAEEEDRRSPYQKLKDAYPHGHFDEGKAKPLFEEKTKAQQLLILKRLRVYAECPRWKDDEGQWIPLASNWIPVCEADPPPSIKKKPKEDLAAKLREEQERRKSWAS